MDISNVIGRCMDQKRENPPQEKSVADELKREISSRIIHYSGSNPPNVDDIYKVFEEAMASMYRGGLHGFLNDYLGDHTSLVGYLRYDLSKRLRSKQVDFPKADLLAWFGRTANAQPPAESAV